MQGASFRGDEFVGFGEERGGEVFDFRLGGGEVGFGREAEGAFLFQGGVEVGGEGVGGRVVVVMVGGGGLWLRWGLADGLGMGELSCWGRGGRLGCGAAGGREKGGKASLEGRADLDGGVRGSGRGWLLVGVIDWVEVVGGLWARLRGAFELVELVFVVG